MIDFIVLEEKDDNANVPNNDEAPETDVCSALLSSDEFTPGVVDEILDFEEEVDTEAVDKFLDAVEKTSEDLKEAVRTFGLAWLPCCAHTLQLPILNAIGKEVFFYFQMYSFLMFCL